MRQCRHAGRWRRHHREDVRNVQLYLNPEAEHLLDWFHLTMRLTVLLQTAKGIPEGCVANHRMSNLCFIPKAQLMGVSGQ
jgi:hypothetical protein